MIAPQTILTAGHGTDFWSTIRADDGLESIMVSFDPQASVDEDWMPDRGTWYAASTWLTHPDYVEAEWPFTFDYGLLYLDEPVEIEPADLPAPNVLQPIIDGKGQTAQRFEDVGYGIQGTIVGNGPPRRAITWERKIAVQRYIPGRGSTTGLFDPLWFILNNAPSPQHGGGCGGDSGSPILSVGTDTIVAVHTAATGSDTTACSAGVSRR